MMVNDHSEHLSLNKGADFETMISTPALCLLISSLRDKQVLSTLGLKTEDISVYEQLEKMSYKDIRKLTGRIKGLVEVRIDLKKLEQGVNGYKKIIQENECIAWLIQNGANKSLIQHLYPSIPNEVVKQQIDYLRTTDTLGRITSIPEQMHPEIIICWHQLQKQGLNTMDMFRKLKQKFPEFTLQQLFNVTSKDYL